jgi:hypothetical protein
MATEGALVLEPDRRARKEFGRVLRSMPLTPVVSSNLTAALSLAAERTIVLVIANIAELSSANAPRASFGPGTATALRVAICRLRETQGNGQSRIPVIVTAEREDVETHATALKAGADLFLSLAEARNETILSGYLRRLLSCHAGRAGVTPSVRYAHTQKPVAGKESRVAEVFQLPTSRFRSESGRLDAVRISEAANVPLRQLAAAIGVKYGTLHKTPDAIGVQSMLAPFANVLAMLDEVYDGDASRVLQWLETEQPSLHDKTPRATLLTPGGARGVEQFITNAWLGAPP